jgi:hypothetical protein
VVIGAQMKWFQAKGNKAARLRQRKFALIRKYGIPDGLLPGSLALTHRRCGKPTCHCASGQGHPLWSLSFSVHGKKHVERIPAAWVPLLCPLVRGGKAYKAAVAEVLAANARLLGLLRRQSERRTRR